MGRLRSRRGEIPLDLVLIVVLVVAVAAGLIWALWGSAFSTALIVVLALAAIVWAYARRIRRREDVSADQQRKVKHDESWLSGKDEE